MHAGKKTKVDKQIKVVFSTPSVSRLYTGVFEVSRNLARELHKSDVAVDVQALIDDYTKDDFSSWTPVKPNTHRVLGPRSVGYSPTYMDALIESDASLGHIHALWSYTSYALYRWSKMTEKGYLLSANGYLDPWAIANSGFKKNIAFRIGFRSVLNNASCIQVNSVLEYESVRKLGLNNPTCLISNGVTLPDLATSYSWPWSSIDQGRKVLLFLGRIDKKKGVDILLQAWKSIVQKGMNKDWHLVFVGFKNDGSKYEESVKSYIEENSLENTVACLEGKYGKEMEACYQNCNAFVLPSFSEGASIAVLSAWAFSKPVIATDECGFPDAALNGCAIKIEPTKNSIQLGISKCIEMNELERSAMGQKGFKLVTEKYSWKVVAKEITNIYKWIISKDHERPDNMLD